ncbi:HNH endonuclease [Pseudomonas syringae group genomosp. 3]|uniref:HNH endonuclease n=1 Tax=Pseudomonas syringae group genomosp. 3 TaxID=251701 RepID=UPI0009BDB31A|nr:HNH endonuclease [Pseudomonas syringae group genomosp. 3]MBM0211863.1 HNH endonuclease [Pseudomonas syringae pv. maculicola]
MPVKPQRHKPATPDTPQHLPAEAQRGTASQRGYNSRWQKARKGYFARHPLCVHCERVGRVTVATDLDHIIPHRGDQTLFWARTNWQGLCHSCHSAKTATEDGGFGNRRLPQGR